MELTYKNITIRNATLEDASLLAAWWNDGSIMSHAGFPRGLGTTPEKIAADLASDSDDTRRRLILLLDGYPIGEMCYYNHGNYVAEIAIKICEQNFQEKRTGRLALSMLIKELLRLGYITVILDTNLKNTRAQHVYELLGFQKKRIHIDSWKNQLGQLESSIDYELTAETFVDFAV